LCPWIFSLT